LAGLFLLLAVSSGCFSQEIYDGPALPDGWYPISDSELTEIEETLKKQETELKTLKDRLETSEIQLDSADKTLNALSLTMSRLETSFRESARVARAWKTTAIVALSVAVIEGILLLIK